MKVATRVLEGYSFYRDVARPSVQDGERDGYSTQSILSAKCHCPPKQAAVYDPIIYDIAGRPRADAANSDENGVPRGKRYSYVA